MINLIILIGILIVIFALFMIFIFMKQKYSFGILGTKKRIYQDTKQFPGENIFAKSLPLVGKPDYLIRDGGYIFPVEIKNSYAPRDQYKNNVMQLMAYCLLVEEKYGIRPPGGYLRYKNAEMKLAYTREAEESVRSLVDEILQNKRTNKEPRCPHPNHNQN